LARYDIHSPRLFVEAALAEDATVALAAPQAHYLRNVLRLKSGDSVLAFNGHDGEWRATLAAAGKRVTLSAQERTREQTTPADLHYLLAPLKHERLDYLVQKAVEMGVSRLQPIMTRRVQVQRVNTARMRANVIEAAEQCGVLSIAEVTEPQPLARALGDCEPERLLVFCDEDAEVKDPIAALTDARGRATARPPLAILVGPEGGFAEDERAALLKLPNVVRLALGPRILRADTAAVAALALVQAVLGDWG
jgi:16S rRNA (uracil1498-N3)-methyltransferase